MTRIAISGIGLLGGFGCGIGDFAAALRAGRAPVKTVSISTPDGPLDVPALLADTARLGDFVDKKALRRIDHHTRMALLACLLALDDAGLDPGRGRMGVVLGTGYGSTCNTFDIEGFCDPGDILRFSPIQFSNSVHNAAGAHIAAFLKSHGPSLTFNQFDLSPAAALLTAGHWLAEGRVDWVLAGAVDDYSRIMAYHRHIRMKGSDCAPAVIGEGSAFFLLGRSGEAPATYGWIQDVTIESGMTESAGILPAIPAGALGILGADGLSPGEAGYARIASDDAVVYSPICGNFPSAPAFDVAAAGLGIRSGALHPPAMDAPLPDGCPAFTRNPRPIAGRKVACVRIGAAGGWARVVLTPKPSDA